MFQRYRLAEISKIKSGKRLPAGCDFSTEVTAHPYIRARDIKNGKLLSDDLAYISDETHRKIQRYIISEGDVAITIVANIGDVGFCDKRLSGANLTENAVRLTDFTNAADGRYLSYYLSQPFMKQYMELLAAGAAQAKLGIYKIEKIAISLPPLPTQRKIAKVLSAYDDLIENNTKRIRILERMIELGYKAIIGVSRFKEKEVRLSSIIQIVRGLSYSSDEIERQEGVRLINLKNINAFGGFRADGTKWYSGKYKTEQIVGCGDLVMGVTDMTQDRRTVGSVALIPTTSETSVISADLIKIESKIDKIFLYAMFRFGGVSKYIALFANGANVLHLRPQCVLKVKVQLPPDEEIARYARFARPLVAEINSCNSQNALLARQRDLLLPRLMSGKLSVEGVKES